MQIRSLLGILVSCCAAFGCATPANEPAAGQLRTVPDPVVRTGSRIPTNDPAATSGTREITRDDWMDQKSREGSRASRQ